MGVSGLSYTRADRARIRKMTDIKCRLREASQKAKESPYSQRDSTQRKLLAKRNTLIARFLKLKVAMKEPHKYKERVRIYDI